ncbi:hypothetical protein AK812_SmicGene48986, partial [Symbiodinium microadriaticum]
MPATPKSSTRPKPTGIKKEPGKATSADDAALLELQRERQLLLQKQDELNRKIALLGDKLPATPSTSAPASRPTTAESEKEADEEAEKSSEDDADDEDWGLGTVVCPKTGKATKRQIDIVLSLDAVKQRLRRMCKRRKSGKVPGGEEALESYKDTGNRKQLAKILVEAKFNEEKEKSLTVDAGWYTEQEMKEKLNY